MGKDDACHGRPKIPITKADMAAVKAVMEHDISLPVLDIASSTGICPGTLEKNVQKL